MRKWLLRILISVFVLVLACLGYFYFQTRDNFPGYKVDLTLSDATAGPIQIGFAKIDVTPVVSDRWTDANQDARFVINDGDTFEDLNGNGQFDPVWIAGFQNRRPAQGVHDPLWARAIVVDNGIYRIAFATVDAIGYGSDDIIAIRKEIEASLDIDYITISASHSHQTPDLLGLWGEGYFSSGVDPNYREAVKKNIAKAIRQANASLRPARLVFTEDLKGALNLVEDSRPPYVMDPGIRLMQAIDAQADTTLGVLFAWANHPETVWSQNLLLSSDFVHYVRKGMEEGVYVGDSLLAPGLGGIAVYVNGAIGGLMTTSPRFPIPSLLGDTVFLEASFAKAEAQGLRLAQLGLQALQDSNRVIIDQAPIQARAITFKVPMDNNLYRLASFMGVLDKGYSGWMKIRTEVACLRLGPASFLLYPGELYPEILNGGVEAPEGNDFGISPIETPPLRSLMPGQFTFTIGLSNDMIGYIVPKSEWDQEAPFIYDYEEAPYGEINSLGPETAPILYEQMRKTIMELRTEN